jgi:hypothetical protein
MATFRRRVFTRHTHQTPRREDNRSANRWSQSPKPRSTHFRHKEQLFIAVCERMAGLLVAQVAEPSSRRTSTPSSPCTWPALEPFPHRGADVDARDAARGDLRAVGPYRDRSPGTTIKAS